MKNIIDIQSLKNLAQISEQPIQLRWPTLLAVLDLESLYTQLPTLNFQVCQNRLHEEDCGIELFDLLFVENISLIKGLREINVSFLMESIAKKSFDKRLLPSLQDYEQRFRNAGSYTMHDLILYLSWERMCVTATCLFDMQSENQHFLKNLEVIKNCLIESYLHIEKEGKTRPSLYRLLEALFFYHMREENLQKHTDEEWLILNQSFPVLKDQNTLADIFYIDDPASEEASYLIGDTPEVVETRHRFVECMLKKELPELRLTKKRIEYVS